MSYSIADIDKSIKELTARSNEALMLVAGLQALKKSMEPIRVAAAPSVFPNNIQIPPNADLVIRKKGTDEVTFAAISNNRAYKINMLSNEWSRHDLISIDFMASNEVAQCNGRQALQIGQLPGWLFFATNRPSDAKYALFCRATERFIGWSTVVNDKIHIWSQIFGEWRYGTIGSPMEDILKAYKVFNANNGEPFNG
jgi:hypothetical protein